MTTLAISPAPIVWIDDELGNIGSVNLDTGAATVVGNPGLALTDLAFSPSQQLFGESYSALYTISTTTGAATRVGAFGVQALNGLVFARDGTLYASGGPDLYTISATTGAATLVGTSGIAGFLSDGDLAFVGGQLYESVSNGLGSDLALVNPATGSATLVGQVVSDPNLFALVTASNGALYGIDGTSIYAIDTATGAGTLVQGYGGSALGMANGAASPTESAPVAGGTITVAAATTITLAGQSSVVVDPTGGADLIVSQGTDTVDAGAGSDVVFASGPAATVNGGAGPLTFVAGSGSYAAGGGSGSDTLYGGGGADRLTGGSGARSILVAGTGNATLSGGGGNAALMFGGLGSTTFVGSGGGNDTMVGGAGANTFDMTGGDVAFGGPNGPDTFDAGTGSALVVEGNGATTVALGGGTLVAFGAGGADTYTISRALGGSAEIVGFKPTDAIDLTGGFTAANASAALATATITAAGTTLHLANGSQIVLYGAGITAHQVGVF